MNITATIAQNTLRPLLTLFIIAVTLQGCTQYQTPKAKGGVLDLRQWDFKNRGPVALDGEWQVSWNEPTDPEHIAPHLMKPTEVPGSWGRASNAPTSATYHLTILLPDSVGQLALNTGTTFNSQRIYWNR